MKNIFYILFLSFAVSSASIACYDEKVSDKQNFDNCLLVAEQGDSDEQNDIGAMYEAGQGVSQDYQKAAYWYAKSANQGNFTAQSNLGTLYVIGEKKDYQQAIYWYRKAAAQGYAAAQDNLGVMYTNGEGTRQNYHTAVKWYIKSAAQNYTLAQFNLALMYYEGLGVDKSIEMSYIWNTIAEYNGNDQASKSRMLDEKKLSPSQIELAKEKADSMYYKIKDGKYFGERRI